MKRKRKNTRCWLSRQTVALRHIKPIIEYGYLYIAQPSLYNLSEGR